MSDPIRRATAAEARRVAKLVATAFTPLPAVAWLLPEPSVRPRVMARNFLILVEHAMEHGRVEVIGDRAAAVWFDRTAPAPEPPDYDRRLAEACDPWTDRFRLLDGLFDEHHPEAPHEHLALLAVDPRSQGRGLGTALLRHRHRHLDQAGVPAYLEASSPQSRDLYLRHGYQLRDPFALPDGTEFWPMWRAPR